MLWGPQARDVTAKVRLADMVGLRRKPLGVSAGVLKRPFETQIGRLHLLTGVPKTFFKVRCLPASPDLTSSLFAVERASRPTWTSFKVS